MCLGSASVGVAEGGSSNHGPRAPLSAQDAGWIMASDLIWPACFFYGLPCSPHLKKKKLDLLFVRMDFIFYCLTCLKVD